MKSYTPAHYKYLPVQQGITQSILFRCLVNLPWHHVACIKFLLMVLPWYQMVPATFYLDQVVLPQHLVSCIKFLLMVLPWYQMAPATICFHLVVLT